MALRHGVAFAALVALTAVAAPSEAAPADTETQCRIVPRVEAESDLVLDVLPGLDFYDRAHDSWLGGGEWIYVKAEEATLDVEFRFWRSGTLEVDGVSRHIDRYESVVVKLTIDELTEFLIATFAEPENAGGNGWDIVEDSDPPSAWGTKPEYDIEPPPSYEVIIKPRPTCPQ